MRLKEVLNTPWKLFIAILFILFAALCLIYAGHFLVPDSDFFDFAEKASVLKNLEWPDNFKRPPLYSVLIALISSVLPGKLAELYAAEFIGIIAGLLSFVFLWRILRLIVPAVAPWTMWVWVFHPSTIRMVVKPKPEIFLTMLILWSIELFIKRDKRAYLVAFIATMVRYEGILLIGAFFLADVIFERKRLRTLLLSMSAGLFILFWSLAQQGGAEGAHYENYFSRYSLNLNFVYMFWAELLGFLPVKLFKLWTVLAAIFFLAGMYAAWKSNKRTCTVLAVFMTGFIALHIVWPFSGPDYMIMVYWVAMLYVIWGIYRFIQFGVEKTEALSKVAGLKQTALALALIVLIGTTLVLVMYKFKYPQYQPHWGWVVAAILPVAVYSWQIFEKNGSAKYLSLVLILTVILTTAYHLNSKMSNDLFEIYYGKAEFRAVGEWYQEHFQPGDRMVVAQPNIVAYYTDLDVNRDFFRLSDAPALQDTAFAEWLKAEKMTYVSWLSYNLMVDQKNAWAGWVAEHRGLGTIAFLAEGKNLPGFKRLKELRVGPRYAYIYRVE